MAESSLSLSYLDYRKEVGGFLGWGRTFESWSQQQLNAVDDVIASGLRQFYVPPLTPGQQSAHVWSFLRPVTTLTTVAADYDYTLPDDFASIDGPFTYAATVQQWPPAQIVGERVIRELRQAVDRSGRPEVAAIRSLASDGTNGQRFEVVFYPTPNAAFTLTYRYNLMPSILSAENPYPLGGELHAQTIRESCLAIAEQQFNDTIGIHTQLFMQRLEASIRMDQRNSAPDLYGYNGDNSRDPGACVRCENRAFVTYNGVLYD